jgi:hypothetical protein
VKPYVIRRLRVRALLGRLPFLLIFGFVAIVLLDVGAFFLAVAAAVVLYGLWTDSLVLKVDASGVRTRRYQVPWSSVRELVLTEGDPPELAVRLLPGASLPSGVRAIIHDPKQPDAIAPGLRTELPPSGIDRARLQQAATDYAEIPLRSA